MHIIPRIFKAKGKTKMFKPYEKCTWSYILALLLSLGLLTACTVEAAQNPPTPTPEVFILRTAVVPLGPMVTVL